MGSKSNIPGDRRGKFSTHPEQQIHALQKHKGELHETIQGKLSEFTEKRKEEEIKSQDSRSSKCSTVAYQKRGVHLDMGSKKPMLTVCLKILRTLKIRRCLIAIRSVQTSPWMSGSAGVVKTGRSGTRVISDDQGQMKRCPFSEEFLGKFLHH